MAEFTVAAVASACLGARRGPWEDWCSTPAQAGRMRFCNDAARPCRIQGMGNAGLIMLKRSARTAVFSFESVTTHGVFAT